MTDRYFEDGREWVRGQTTASDLGAWLAIISSMQAYLHDYEHFWMETEMKRLHADIIEAFGVTLEKRS